MKYFTPKWWRGELSDDEFEKTLEDYRQYIASVRGQLPKGARMLEEDVSLHDARLRTLNADFAAGRVRIEFDGFDTTKSPSSRIRITLIYEGVRELVSSADPESPFEGSDGYGDLGYDEFEVLKGGLFEHRILFSSGIELRIQFKGLQTTTVIGAHK